MEAPEIRDKANFLQKRMFAIIETAFERTAAEQRGANFYNDVVISFLLTEIAVLQERIEHLENKKQ